MKMNTKTLVEAAILAALSTVIITVSYYIPALLTVGAIAWSIPITLLTFKYDIKISILTLIVSLLISSAFITPITAAGIAILYGLPALILGLCLRKKYPPFTTLISMSIAMFLSYVLTFKFSEIITGKDILQEFLEIMKQAVTYSKDWALKYGGNQKNIEDVFNRYLDVELVKMALPGAMIVASVFGSFLDYYIVQIIFRKLNLKINELKPIENWYISNSTSYGIFFLTIISLILLKSGVNNAEIISATVYSIFVFAFAVQGIALISWLLKRRGVPGKLVILLDVLILIMFSQILFFIGILDYVMDFRKINPARRNKFPGE